MMLDEGKNDDKKTGGLQKICIMLYGIYALSAVLQFSETTLLLGLLALVIGYILTNNKKEAARGTVYESHLQWLTRTFWIGTAVIVPVAIVIATLLILQFTDIASITTTLSGDDPNAMMNGINGYMAANLRKVTLITMITMAPTVVWWVRRCWVGYLLAKEGKPVENVKTWL